jgi:hypothetical protein
MTRDALDINEKMLFGALRSNPHCKKLFAAFDAYESDQALIGNLCDALKSVQTCSTLQYAKELAEAALAVAKQREEKP